MVQDAFIVISELVNKYISIIKGRESVALYHEKSRPLYFVRILCFGRHLPRL